jgi:hypothetical protein
MGRERLEQDEEFPAAAPGYKPGNGWTRASNAEHEVVTTGTAEDRRTVRADRVRREPTVSPHRGERP